MAKNYSEFICQQCGFKSASFLGKCPQCGQWNSLVETVISVSSASKFPISNINLDEHLVKLSQVKSEHIKRFSCGFLEFDRVLGGGIVPGSIILIAGDPGIGKSTLLLQSAIRFAQNKTDKKENTVLYVTGEESAQQVKLRADRIIASGNKNKSVLDNLYIFAQTDIEAIIAASEKLNPSLIIVDSIQTLASSNLTGSAGSVGQVRECSQILQRFAKSSKIPIFIVGHVTKEGNVAGPKVLEHLVDAVLNLEGDGMHTYRILRSIKNRFGSTFEVGVFEMRDSGMEEVTNPSQIFLPQNAQVRSGSVICATIAGGRPILCEIQALCTPTMFGIPTRRFTGLDFNRMQTVIAALSKVAKIGFANLDIYLNVAGGLKVVEPAADLAAALAIVSASMDKPISANTCAFGEVGLLGELRSVGNIAVRKAEARRMGFSNFVTVEKFTTLSSAIKHILG